MTHAECLYSVSLCSVFLVVLHLVFFIVIILGRLYMLLRVHYNGNRVNTVNNKLMRTFIAVYPSKSINCWLRTTLNISLTNQEYLCKGWLFRDKNMSNASQKNNFQNLHQTFDSMSENKNNKKQFQAWLIFMYMYILSLISPIAVIIWTMSRKLAMPSVSCRSYQIYTRVASLRGHNISKVHHAN